MTVLCVVDTCSLVYLSEIELANKSLHGWLWDEFEVAYSQVAWEEIQVHGRDMGHDASALRSKGSGYVWPLSTMQTCEGALFVSPFLRQIEIGRCKQCKRPITEPRPLEVDLGQETNRGERHNCCVALDAVLTGKCTQVIFLTDDFRAVRDYAGPVFEVFPLGCIWSSHDLVLYLFMRHRRRIPRQSAENAIRDVVAKATRSLSQLPEGVAHEAKSKWMGRLTAYHSKVERVDMVLGRFKGGH